MLELPADRPRPAIQTFDGATCSIQLDRAQTRGLSTLAARQGTTLYVTLLAAFQALLSRYTGLDDIIVGSPVAGRTDAGLSGVSGYFVNPLPIRSSVAGDPPFEEFVARVRAAVLEGLEHQGFPFPQMVERLELARDPSRSPIFQVMSSSSRKAQRLDKEGLTSFTLQETGPSLHLGGVMLESVAIDLKVAHFDLTLTAHEHDGAITATLEYNTDLFDASTAERILESYRTLLDGVAAGPDRRVSALPVLSEIERSKVLGLIGTRLRAIRNRGPASIACSRCRPSGTTTPSRRRSTARR